MSDADTIRARVSETYTRAVAAGGGCCGTTEPKGAAARLAGYDAAAVPEGALSDSFGCGNPLAFGEVQPGQVVLDLGSGAGLDLLVAADRVGPAGRVIGVDMTDEMIARARAHADAAGARNVEVRKGLIEALPVEDASVDWVISNCVINLSPEKDRVFSEIARVLKPGGRMLVSDIVVEDLPAYLRELPQVYDSCVGGALSEGEYAEGLRRAGLVDVEVRGRLVYDAAAIRALVDSELPKVEAAVGCCGGNALDALIERAAADVEGKVQSVYFAARKP